MLAKVYAAQVVGLQADTVEVEVDIAKGLHSFAIVGLVLDLVYVFLTAIFLFC